MNDRENEGIYPEIQPLFEVNERRKMTVEELISALKEYPPDSIIHINIYNELNQFLEIKDISVIIDANTNEAHPVLNIDKIKISKNMYRMIIMIKHDVADGELQHLRLSAESAFVNRAGEVKNISKEPYRVEFIGGEKERGCLDIGFLILKDDKTFLQNVSSWQWVDEDELNESCDALEEISKPVK